MRQRWFALVLGFSLCLIGGVGFAISPAFAQGTGDGCSTHASASEVQALQQQSNTDPTSWSCQKVDLNKTGYLTSCVVGGCPGQPSDVLCCLPIVSAASQGGTTTPSTGGGAGVVSSWIPKSLQQCMDVGSCSLDQIVATGSAFANFLFGLSGALALAILVYGGFLYLIAGGSSEKVAKAKHILVDAAVGLALIFGANALIRFVYFSLTRQTETIAQLCEDRPSYSCQVVPGTNVSEVKKNATASGCEVKDQNLCNVAGQGPNVYCCPLEPPK